MQPIETTAGELPSLFRVHPLGVFEFDTLHDLAAALHEERGARKLSLQPIDAWYDARRIDHGIRIGFVEVAGADEWFGIVSAPDLTVESLRRALKETVPARPQAAVELVA